jgi:signal transduction histidine kinase
LLRLGGGKIARILHVEDDEGMCFLMQKYLSSAGHEVVMATDGMEAIEKVQSEPFDMALVDVHLGGGMEGTAVATRIRDLAPDVILVAISGSVDPDMSDLMVAAGCVGFISKPLPPKEEFLALIEGYLAGRREHVNDERRIAMMDRHQTELVRELQRALQEERRANAELRKLGEAKDEFMRIAAHELRTPLAVILGHVSMWELGVPPQEDSVAAVSRNTQHLSCLVSDMLEFARLETGQVTIQRVSVELSKLLARIVGDLQELGPVEFQDNGRGPVWVCCDETKTAQILSNLVNNSIAASKSKPGAGPVTVSYEPRATDVVVHVTDQGVGIPKDQMAKLWEKFSKPEAEGYVHDGLGLGLVISAELVRRQGGEIWAESELGEGSTFSFTLPYAEREEH